jgi:hypothetical protein
MSRTFHYGDRRIRVRGIQRRDADLRKLARALIELAQAQAEADAQQQHQHQTRNVVPLRPNKPAGPKQDAA